MMKTLSVISCLLICSCISQIDNNDLIEENLKGKVRMVVETEHDAIEKFGEIQNARLYDSTIILYNEKGNITERSYYEADRSLRIKLVFKYLDNKYLSERCDYKSNGEIDRRYTIKNNNQGTIEEMNEYDATGSLIYKTTYRYDENGNRNEESKFDETGYLLYMIIYKYNEAQNLTDENWYNHDGTLRYKYENIYDELNNIAEVKKLDSDNKLLYLEKYKYDGSGNITENYFEYIEEDMDFPNGSKKRTIGFVYDNFDKKGNWLSRIRYVDKNLADLTQRIIDYY